MNAAHFHLIVNHLPIVGLLFSLALLGISQFFRATGPGLRSAALVCVVVSALFLVPTYLSGEGAEEVVEHMPGVSEALIHDHEERAEAGLVFGLIAGALAMGTLMLRRRAAWVERSGPWATLVIGAAALVVLGLVAQSGGQIAHPETRDVLAAAGTNAPSDRSLEKETELPAHSDHDDD